MTDRELLEAAAKAAGLTIEYWAQDDYPVVYDGNSSVGWDPLTFDSDALRLAVKLHIQVTPGTYNKDKYEAFNPAGVDEACEFRSWLQNEFAATRRAIVRAAAALAKGQP